MIMHVMFYVDSTSILPTGKSVKSYAFGENSEENSCTRQHFSPAKPLHERHLNKKRKTPCHYDSLLCQMRPFYDYDIENSRHCRYFFFVVMHNVIAVN